MKLFNFFNKKPKGIEDSKFNSQQYQIEILALARTVYFSEKQNYDVVKSELLKEGLNNKQSDLVIENLKRLNTATADKFDQDLASGKIKDIKIKPNSEHIKGEVDADTVDKYIGFGAWQMDRGDFDNALELFDKAIALNERATLAYANKGSLFLQKGDSDKALHFYNKALEIEPDSVEILENKMEVLFDTMKNDSDEEEFIRTVKTILSNDAENPNALVYIIQFHLKENDLEKALKSVKKLFSIHHRKTVAIQLLLAVFNRFPYEKAVAEFSSFNKEIEPAGQYQLEYCKGLYIKGINRYDEAIALYKNLNKIQEFSWNYYQIGIMKNLQSKTDEAFKYLKLAFDMEPELKEDAKVFPELENLWDNPEFIKLIS
ncbi:hypothetical protein GCM10007424_03100 [Flavobacterium suaedae]|uniref:Tetratricopeptide repeat protein n=1 Tax=Flavobacterium suaedae TaxID=1767027 RepID=A0ABQ1JEP2_9FLAO|nr:tetratricopeptide repeat protein [Flavobacterium suaedae]GGB66514.1 hypothetical protein GCM10007424_03100 [Flavobacterium suaedae]